MDIKKILDSCSSKKDVMEAFRKGEIITNKAVDFHLITKKLMELGEIEIAVNFYSIAISLENKKELSKLKEEIALLTNTPKILGQIKEKVDSMKRIINKEV